MLNLVIFGAPGTGKGTQSMNIVTKYNLIHLSTGDILREEIRNESKIGLLAKRYIDDGLLVPDSVILKQLYHRASRHNQPNGFIFDGFPRTLVQAQILDKALDKKGIPILRVLYLNVSEDELFRRIMYRGSHSARSDDNEETIRKRLREFYDKTYPLLDYYSANGRLEPIDGMGSIDDVFALISGVIDQVIDNNQLKLN